MKEQKVVYVKAGEVMEVERLVDAMTGNGIFLIKRGGGVAIWAKEIVAGDVLLTTEEGRMKKFLTEGLYYDLFLVIENAVEAGSARKGMLNGMEHIYLSTQNLAALFNQVHALKYRGVVARTVGNACREMGFRIMRSGFGYAVVLDDEDFAVVKEWFNLQK